jgi:uncharacterized membrane protein
LSAVLGLLAWTLRTATPAAALTGATINAGLMFLLGATLERAGWLNNDGVNFLSTGSAAGFALAMLGMLPQP